MKKYLLGVDIGTSACKVAVFDREGRVMAQGSGGYEVYYPRAGWAEQDPEEWWRAVCLAIREALESGDIDPEQIAGIGVDGQSWSAVAVDEKGGVLANTPIWMDTRAKEICEDLNQKIGKDRIFALCGNSLQPCYSTAKVLWYRDQMPKVYRQIHKILQSNSFIVYRLTGRFCQDKSQGYGFHCFDMRTGSWNEEMCRALGIPRSFLPDIHECSQIVGEVTGEAARQTGLAPGTPVAAGGLDAACGALGAGVVSAGQTQEQGGQAGGMSICMDRYLADPSLILSFHVVSGKWLLQGGTTGGGGVMRWVERELGAYEREVCGREGKSSLELLNDLAAAVAPGSDGVVFLPYMSGERSPIWDPDAKGVFFGLDFGKTKGHLVRSAMEGVAFSLKHNLDAAKAVGAEAGELRAMGGSANSLLWTQIKSDVTGKPVLVPSSDTATTLGAALLAGVGTGMYRDFDEAARETVQIKRSHEPDARLGAVYDGNYSVYRKLYEQLKDLMKEAGGKQR